MKRMILTALAGIALASPFAFSNASAAPGDDRRDDRRGEQSRRDDNRGEQGQYRQDDRQDARHNNRDRRQRWRDTRRDARFDEHQHNGYYYHSRFYYGPPPQARYNSRNFALGYQPWHRGQRLGYYNGRYAEVDYRTRHDLRRPPRGYHWVRNDGGDYLLAAVVSGLILQVIINSGR